MSSRFSAIFSNLNKKQSLRQFNKESSHGNSRFLSLHETPKGNRIDKLTRKGSLSPKNSSLLRNPEDIDKALKFCSICDPNFESPFKFNPGQKQASGTKQPHKEVRIQVKPSQSLKNSFERKPPREKYPTDASEAVKMANLINTAAKRASVDDERKRVTVRRSEYAKKLPRSPQPERKIKLISKKQRESMDRLSAPGKKKSSDVSLDSIPQLSLPNSARQSKNTSRTITPKRSPRSRNSSEERLIELVPYQIKSKKEPPSISVSQISHTKTRSLDNKPLHSDPPSILKAPEKTESKSKLQKDEPKKYVGKNIMHKTEDEILTWIPAFDLLMDRKVAKALRILGGFATFLESKKLF